MRQAVTNSGAGMTRGTPTSGSNPALPCKRGCPVFGDGSTAFEGRRLTRAYTHSTA